MVYISNMAVSEKVVRQSVSLPSPLARQVRKLAKVQCKSANKVILDLIGKGIESQDREKARFLALAEALVSAKSPKERQRLKEELAKMVFGQ
ncbi:MAG: hypothetical protein HY717_18895 [Planctomycetes bacterium]|nr:hypothetical protein [Planctomycetota bacterium]